MISQNSKVTTATNITSSNRLRKTKPLIVILVLSVFIRFPLLWGVAHLRDLIQFQEWAQIANTHGLFNVYKDYGYEIPNHPPLDITFFALSSRVYEALGGSTDSPPDVNPVQIHVWYIVTLKILPLIFDLLLICATYLIFSYQSSGLLAAFAASSIAFNPALFYDSIWWGQTDVVLVFFLVLTIFALVRKHTYMAWILYAFALLTKFQAIPLLPLLAIFTWRRCGLLSLLRHIIMTFGIWLLVSLPFILGSGLKPAMTPYLEANKFPYITLHAHNFWYWQYSPYYDLDNSPIQLIPKDAPDENNTDNVIYVGPINARTFGFALFGLVVLLVCVRIWLDPFTHNEFWFASVLFFAFYMLATEMHERYFYPSLVLLLFASIQQRWRFLLYGVFTITSTFTILSVGLKDFFLFDWIYQMMPWNGYWVAFANILILVSILVVMTIPIVKTIQTHLSQRTPIDGYQFGSRHNG